MLRQLVLLLPLIVGCPSAPAGDDDDDSAVTDDDDATPARIEPAEGLWALTLTAHGIDDCDLEPSSEPGDSLGTTELVVVATADHDFVLTDSDDQVFRCAWTDGNDFACEADLWTTQISPALFPNHTINRTGSRTGTFDSPTSATLSNINSDDCEGTDCPSLEAAGGYTFPCALGFDATMTR